MILFSILYNKIIIITFFLSGVNGMKIAFMFSGQGAQFPGMMKDLYETEGAARQVFDTADAALGRGISSLCFEGTQDELNLTHNT